MLLDRVSRIETDPFPHVIVENALPEDFYRELERTRPTPEQIIAGRYPAANHRFDMPTALAVQKLSPVWSEFCLEHISTKFWDRIFELFGDEIAKRYPKLPNAVRFECQPGVNTPSHVLSKVRGPHLDNPKELYAGLFYMASDSDGGDLELYSWKGEKRFHGKLEVEEECVELVKTVPYKANTFVFFINTPDSLHGVTPRRSKHYRKLVNVIADMREPLFRVGHGKY